jgi:tetratricopeptide (TPR) repeat protein
MSNQFKHSMSLIILLFAGCVAILGPNLKPGLDLQEAGDYAGALAFYESIVKSEKASAKVYALAYESAFRAGKLKSSSDYYNLAMESGFDPDSLDRLALKLWYDRFQMLMGKDEWKSAESAADVVAKLAPDSDRDKFCRYVVEGRRKFKKGAHKLLWDAVDDYTRAANYDTKSGLPYFLMGKARFKNNKNDFDAALDEFRRALEIEPDGYFASEAKAEIERISKLKKKMEAFWGK